MKQVELRKSRSRSHGMRHVGAAFAFLLAMLVPMLASAQFKAGRVLQTTKLTNTPGMELQHNVIYEVTSSMTITSTKTGVSGLTVTRNAVATLYIAKDVTLTINGAAGNGRMPGAPAIQVPEGSTLIITGEGRLVANGGNAGAGGAGQNGGNAWLNKGNENGAGGAGGAGGDGGGGAAPGIGAMGGDGALGFGGPAGNTRPCEQGDYDGSGNDGYASRDGANGKSMGTVYILGSVRVEANAGKAPFTAASAGANYGSWATDAGSHWTYNYTSGAGGPGGGGGSGYLPTYGIGGGAPGGQCGATGGSGGTMKNCQPNRSEIKGGGGKGGYGGVNGKDSDKGRTSDYGKSGGNGGGHKTNAATSGSHGYLYKQASATLANSGRTPNEGCNIPSQISITCYLNPNEGTTNQNEAMMYYGIKPAKLVSLPVNGHKYFDGYYTDKVGGTQVIDATGQFVASVSTQKADFTVYAHWYDGFIKTTGSNFFATNYVATTDKAVLRVMNKEGVEVETPIEKSITSSKTLRPTYVSSDLNSGSSVSEESASCLVDASSVETKWCVTNFNSGAYIVVDANESVLLKSIKLWNGNDTGTYSGRRWKTISVYGSNSSSGSWHEIVRNQSLNLKATSSDYAGALTMPQSLKDQFRYYKIVVESIHDGTVMQMSDMLFDVQKISSQPINISGEIKKAEILEDGKVMRRYIIAHHDGKTCLFEDCTTFKYIFQNSGSPDDFTNNKCNHALTGGRSAYYDTGQTKMDEEHHYTIKQCFLCDAKKDVINDRDFVELAGNSYVDTGYMPNDKTAVYGEMQFESAVLSPPYFAPMKDKFESNNYPIEAAYKYTCVQALYDKSMFGKKPCTIKAFSLYVSQAYTLYNTDFKIYMGYKAEDHFSSSGDYVKSSDLTLVYDHANQIAKNVGWETYTLDTPFEYNGKDHLVIVITRVGSTGTDGNKNTAKYYHDTNPVRSLNILYSRSATDETSAQLRDKAYDCTASGRPYISFEVEYTKMTHYNPFGATDKNGVGYFMCLDCDNDNNYLNTTFATANKNVYGEKGKDVLYPRIDYDVLLAPKSAIICEDELKTTSVMDLSWKEGGTTMTLPMYLGAANKNGKVADAMEGRLYNFNIMENGKPSHRYIPAIYKKEVGLYDMEKDTTVIFKEIEGGEAAQSFISAKRCPHYVRAIEKDGRIDSRCQVCDGKEDIHYYYDVTYEPNIDKADGIMTKQRILDKGNLLPNEFSKPMHAFKGWSTSSEGTKQYDNQQVLTADKDKCGNLKLYAQWAECYAVHGDTLPIPDNNIVASVEIEDRDFEHNAMSTLRPITIQSFSYVHELKDKMAWGTFCVPIELQSNDSITYYTNVTVEGEKLILSRADKVEPNTPCIFHITKSGMKEIRLKGNNVTFSGETMQSNDEIALTGTYEGIQIDLREQGSYCYAIADNHFYLVRSSVVVNPFRAYLRVNVPAGSQVREQLTIYEKDAQTGMLLPTSSVLAPDGKFMENHQVIIRKNGNKYSTTGIKK